MSIPAIICWYIAAIGLIVFIDLGWLNWLDRIPGIRYIRWVWYWITDVLLRRRQRHQA